ncbi:2-hydroxychromene-2-carboxylate isomerase [Micromonospora sp. DT201]|uniref:2-hydroxychromene-2-carboxylate isomerase n=1 Tax=Micromonospora sp. DT201 TaxID=3393442 RepID=UPI003CE85E5A
MPTPKRPRWYYSLRSPYSWLAYRDLADRFPEVLETVEWIPFWEPDELTSRLLDEAKVELPIVAMSRAKNFYILQDVRRLTRARGWDVTWPIDKDPCWEIPHLAYLLAADAGRGREFVDAAYRARWQEARDIADRVTVKEIGDGIGLDGDVLAAASDDPELRARGVACLTSSWRDGLFGVPFFVHGREKYFGLDRLLPWAAAVRGGDLPEQTTTWQEYAAVPEFSAAGADGGPAGGCA